MNPYPDATVRFVADASQLGLEVEPVVYPNGTKTAAAAAAAIGCDVSAIVKSLLFIAGGAPVLVMMSGDLRVDLDKLGVLCRSGNVRRATLDEVRTHTGYVAGGTPPIGHAGTFDVYADHSLRRNQVVWAAAGTPTTVFPADRDRLIDVAGAVWADLAERPPIPAPE